MGEGRDWQTAQLAGAFWGGFFSWGGWGWGGGGECFWIRGGGGGCSRYGEVRVILDRGGGIVAGVGCFWIGGGGGIVAGVGCFWIGGGGVL